MLKSLYPKLILLIAILLLNSNAWVQQNTTGSTVTALTMSDVNKILKSVSLQIPLRANTTDTRINLFDDSYMIHLINYLDLNYIGAGQSVTLSPESIISFILGRLEQGETLNTIGLEMVAEFERTRFREVVGDKETQAIEQIFKPDVGKIKVGGFLVTEFEYHQEPDGEYLSLLEINQARIYFATEINPTDRANNINLLAEFNPVPEEVIHHIDDIGITRNTISDTIRFQEQEIEGLIPFEQLYMKIQNVASSGVELTIGQFRNPFGRWSDFTSHRNFSSTKNNIAVNGFALKKIELGLMLTKDFDSGLNIRTALLHGRLGRTADLDRADHDNSKDFVGRIGYTRQGMTLGASTYLAEFATNRVAYGADFSVSASRFTVAGELVYQHNQDVNATFGTNFNFTDVSSLAGYINYDYSISTKIHFYGLYEYWRFSADSEALNDPAFKVFHGLRYHIHPQLRWTLVEFGRMFHNNFDDGKLHLSTQMELTF